VATSVPKYLTFEADSKVRVTSKGKGSGQECTFRKNWVGFAQGRPFSQKRSGTGLLNRTSYVGKHVVRIGSDQLDCANDKHQNDGQHHRIFSDVLSFLFQPQLTK
jgi:hypothetical protein